jgi:hypothetical protein
MHATNSAARAVVVLYALMGIPAVFSFVYVPRTLIVPGNATATASKILASEMLFRAGIVAGLASAVFFLLLGMALYRLLSGVNQTQAALMVLLVVVSATIGFLNEVNNLVALILFRGGDFLAVFAEPQRDALAMLFLRLHAEVTLANEIFWGLWLFPFGVLVMRSHFLPRILGVLLVVNCVAWVVASIASLLLPGAGNIVSRVILPALFGEMWIWLWLLIKGVKAEPLTAAAH